MLIWFNHPSVASIATTLPLQPNEIGCNYFYQIRPTAHIVVYDPQTRDLITKDTKNTKMFNTTFWAKNGFKTAFFKEVITPTRLRPQDSGTLAIALALWHLSAKDITIIGCGWHKNDTSSLFDQYYTHKKGASKVSNPKLKLLRNYQSEFNIKIRFLSDTIIDPAFNHLTIEDLSISRSADISYLK
jgi:hypothetical protein